MDSHEFREIDDGPADEWGRRPRRGLALDLDDGSELRAYDYGGPALVARPGQPTPVQSLHVEVVGADPARFPTIEEASRAMAELGGGVFVVQLMIVPDLPIEVPDGVGVGFVKVADVDHAPPKLASV